MYEGLFHWFYPPKESSLKNESRGPFGLSVSLLDAKSQPLEIQNRTPNSKKWLPELDGSFEVEENYQVHRKMRWKIALKLI